jgi:hypothetical protein
MVRAAEIGDDGLEIRIVRGRNTGAELSSSELDLVGS